MDIYLDHAATSSMSKTAVDTYLKYTDGKYANPSSLHSLGQNANEALHRALSETANILGCEEKEIIFTSGGSEADNQAIITAAAIGEKKGKKHIITTKFEHHAVLNPLAQLEKKGFEVTYLDVNENGVINPSQVQNAIRSDTVFVSIMYANNEIGTIQPIKEIGKICKENNILFHTDAVQAAGQIKINVKEQNIDMLTLSAHKFGGPKGIGILYANKTVPVKPLIYGGEQQRGKRAGTENLPAIMSMASALKEKCENIDENTKKCVRLRDMLIDGLSEIPHSILNGDAKCRLPGNVNFCFEGIEGESLILLLNDFGIYASSGSACTSGSLEPSHVLLALGRSHEIAHGSLRLTLSEENTEEEIKYTIECVKSTVEKLRSFSPVWRELMNGTREFIIKD